MNRTGLYDKLISLGYEFTNPDIREEKKMVENFANLGIKIENRILERTIKYDDLWLMKKLDENIHDDVYIIIWFSSKRIKKYCEYTNCLSAMCPEEEIYEEIEIPFTNKEKEIFKEFGVV